MLPVWYLRFLKYQGIKVILLIHDLDRLRQGHQDLSRLERNTFNAASGLIVHTPSMADYLQSQGIKALQQILYLFDYYTDTDSFRQPENIGSIVFCGNLGKSGFLSVFDEQNWNLPTYLYGVGAKKQYGNLTCIIWAYFRPMILRISKVRGGWCGTARMPTRAAHRP